MAHTFSIREAIVFGWHKLKQRSGLVFGVVLTLFAFNILSSMLEEAFKEAPLGFVVSILTFLASMVLGAGVALIFLRIAKGEDAKYGDIIPEFWTIWRYFWTSTFTTALVLIPLAIGALVSLIVLVATGSVSFSEGAPPFSTENIAAVVFAGVVMLAAIVAMVYLGIRYSVATLAAIEGEAIIESIRKSARITKPAMGQLFLLMLALIGINILGLLALVVGLLVSIPVSAIAFSHVYLKLKGHH